jgi:hypothetical protein
MRTQAAVAAAVLLALSAAVNATVIRVDADGGGDHLTIQAGINAAVEGDTVLVAAAVYKGEGNTGLDFGGTNIVLVSESGRDSTLIDCEFSSSGFYLQSGEDTTSVIRGFTVAHADGAFDFSGASPRVEDCRIERSWWDAGRLTGSGAIFRNTVVYGEHGNGQPRDYGFYCRLGPPAPTFIGCTFEGIYIALVSNGASFVMRDCEFFDCWGGDYGVIPCSNCSPVIEDVLMVDCYINDYEWVGDAMSFLDCDALVERVAFIRCGYAHFGTVHLEGGTLTLRDCVFVDDLSSPVIHGWGDGAINIENVTIVNADVGHAIGVRWGTTTIDVSNSIIAFGHRAAVDDQSTGTITVSRSCVFGNAWGDSLACTHYENLFVNPLFCDQMDDDFTLHDDSPCLPGGNPWGVLMGRFGAGGCGTGVDQGGETDAFELRLSSPVLADGPVPLAYYAPTAGVPVEISISNVRGALVTRLEHVPSSAGLQKIQWDGADASGHLVASGVYFVKLSVNGQPAAQERAKLVVVR